MSQTKAQLIDAVDGSIVTADLADDAVNAAKLASNAVVNASVDASAAIAGSKISPNFGSQNIVTTGNLGLGTTSPSTNLDVQGAGSPSIKVTDTTNTTTAQVSANDTKALYGSLTNHAVQIDQNGGAALFINTSKNIGIGTTSPSNKLHVHGDAGSPPKIIISEGGAQSAIRATRNSDNNGDLRFQTEIGGSIADRMVIDYSANVGIGTTSPGRQLEVNADSANTFIRIRSSDTGNAGFEFGDQSDTVQGAIFQNSSDNSVRFNGFNNAERMRIDSSGNVGIGTTSPTAPFHVKHAVTNAVAHFESGDANVSIKFLDNSTSTAPAIGATGDNLTISTGGLERVNVDGSNGRVGIGTTSQASPLHVFHSTTNAAIRAESGDEFVHIELKDSTTSSIPYVGAQGDAVRIITGGTQRFRIDNDADLIGFSSATNRTFNEMKTATGTGNEGSRIGSDGAMVIGASNTGQLLLNRRTTDGTLINFLQNGTSEGSIDVSGSTVSLNGGHLSRWSQLSGISSTDKSARPTIYQGTVMSNLDELCTWSHPAELWTRDVLYTAEDTLPEGKSVGDVQFAKGSVRREAYTEENQQLNMTKVSDTEGDKDVAGVFWAWDDDDDEIVNDFFIAMTGDMVIRVAASTTVARGDLLISAGDGTAKPQADDIIRSSTIAKIISTNSTATYPDGSKAYPCVLMAC